MSKFEKLYNLLPIESIKYYKENEEDYQLQEKDFSEYHIYRVFSLDNMKNAIYIFYKDKFIQELSEEEQDILVAYRNNELIASVSNSILFYKNGILDTVYTPF